ncbi:putative galacturonosyltransferase 14 [Hordeum vulgare]|nr:putative galacturonosyltransferase 14 [Hordeum vulgare]
MPFKGIASTASDVFNEMAGSNDATAEFVNLLDTNTVDIDQALIGDFNCNEVDGGVDGQSSEDEVEEIHEGCMTKRKSSPGYAFGAGVGTSAGDELGGGDGTDGDGAE